MNEKFNKKSSLSYVYGKALGQLLRFCGIVKLINNICELVENNENLIESQDEFVKFIQNQNVDLIIKQVYHSYIDL